MTTPEEIAREIVDKWWGLPEYIKTPPPEYERLVGAIAAALAASEQRVREESQIVDRCWKALGIATYEQAGGKAIDEIIADNKRALEIARKEIVALSAENGRLRIIALASQGSPQEQ